MWGYSPLRGGSEVYEVHHNSALEPFKLHLVGDGLLDIPEALENVVVIHRGLSYFDFYALMQSMDVVVPAFVNRDCEILFYFGYEQGLGLMGDWV